MMIKESGSKTHLPNKPELNSSLRSKSMGTSSSRWTSSKAQRKMNIIDGLNRHIYNKADAEVVKTELDPSQSQKEDTMKSEEFEVDGKKLKRGRAKHYV